MKRAIVQVIMAVVMVGFHAAMSLVQQSLLPRKLSPPVDSTLFMSSGDGEKEGSDAPFSEDEGTAYAVGVNVGRTLKELKAFEGRELEMVLEGIGDFLQDNDPKVLMAEYGPKTTAFFDKRRKEASERARRREEAFLDAGAAESGAVRTESGLVVKHITVGEGATPAIDDTVRVSYEGMLTSGAVFDSSYVRGAPTDFPLKSIIKGWQEGLQLMKVGGTAKLTVPSALAYGDEGTGPIPGMEPLTFQVSLVGINLTEGGVVGSL